MFHVPCDNTSGNTANSELSTAQYPDQAFLDSLLSLGYKEDPGDPEAQEGTSFLTGSAPSVSIARRGTTGLGDCSGWHAAGHSAVAVGNVIPRVGSNTLAPGSQDSPFWQPKASEEFSVAPTINATLAPTQMTYPGTPASLMVDQRHMSSSQATHLAQGYEDTRASSDQRRPFQLHSPNLTGMSSSHGRRMGPLGSRASHTSAAPPGSSYIPQHHRQNRHRERRGSKFRRRTGTGESGTG